MFRGRGGTSSSIQSAPCPAAGFSACPNTLVVLVNTKLSTPAPTAVGGVIVYEAYNIDQAVSLAQKSPGLKYGFTHEVFPEISLNQAAHE
jgi:hypothetical protein